MIMKLYSSPWPFAVTRARVTAAATGGWEGGITLVQCCLVENSPRVFMLG